MHTNTRTYTHILHYCHLDDRFIMKHIKSIEISSFEQFAPHYLEHVNKALEEKVEKYYTCRMVPESIFTFVCLRGTSLLNVLIITNMTSFICVQRPLTLAKIVGAYSIGFKNTKTGNSKRLDVVVMENLLYGHAQTNTKVQHNI